MSKFFTSFRKLLTQFTAEIVDNPRSLTVNNLIELQMDGARCFLGVKEVGKNLGPEVETFQSATKAKGLAWCASFVIYVVNEGVCKALPIALSDVLPRTASTQNLYGWAKKNNYITKTPKFGDLAIWRNGNTWKGHVAFVAEVNEFDKKFTSIDGNTDATGGREGDGVYERNRSYKFMSEIKDKLWLRGFVDMTKVYQDALEKESKFYKELFEKKPQEIVEILKEKDGSL